MTKSERMTKPETRTATYSDVGSIRAVLALRHLSFGLLSSFVIRHSSFALLLLSIALAGCTTRSKAKTEAQAAFSAGQQEAMLRQKQPHSPIVTIVGQVRNP